jgi:adenylate cyclase class IV
MIEVEKKFLLSGDEEARLIEGAQLISEKVINDSYYDNNDYDITLANMWLRQRDNAFELKVPLRVSDNRTVDQFREITDQLQIAVMLGLPADEPNFAMVLQKAKYVPFMNVYTTRRTYRKDGFTIDLDTVMYENSEFRYAIAEIEKLVEDEADMPAAVNDIIAFAAEHGLTTDQFILGKVGAFLKSEKPSHYEALVAVGIL